MSVRGHDSDDPNATILKSATSRINAMRKRLARLDLSSLPRFKITDEDVSERLPRAMAAIYFLLHPTEGVLYIGKAHNLKGRWSPNFFRRTPHECFEGALELGDVELAWWAVPKEYLTALEALLIQIWSPKWNVHERPEVSP